MKPDYSDSKTKDSPKKYRPISLINIDVKMLSNVLTNSTVQEKGNTS